MTRETKIGLLVGLAFIIVIGILLSDHINAAGDPLLANKTQIYSTVEAGINSPHAQPQGETVMIQPQAVIPQNRIKTEPENEPRPSTGSSMIVVGPGKDPSQIPVPQRQPVVQGPVQTQDGSDQTNAQGPVVLSPGNVQVAGNDRQTNPEPATGNSGMTQLVNEARNRDVEIVSAGTGKPVGVSVPKPGVDLVARPDARQVVAEENDTVSKFASKYMGANTKANREAIIKANPSVGPDGSKVFAGKTYVIPAPAAGPAQTTTSGNQGVAQAQPRQPVRLSPQATTPSPAPTPTPNTTMYTVKENDTLWKIASEQLGSGARYTEIVELNKDVLKGGAQVRPNMRLKLPAKAVATNN